MQEISFEDLPNQLRVRLSPQGAAALWEQVENQGGITAAAKRYDFPRSKLYNWRHKGGFLPVDFVRSVYPDAEREIVALKGMSRSKPLQQPQFPLQVSDELLTRVAVSVYTNQDGVPTYQAGDAGLVNRFVTLLDPLGDVQVSLYHRNVYELRYPKYLHDLFQTLEYEQDFAALVDEEGAVDGDRVVCGEQAVPVEQFNGELFHRGKKLQLALAHGDSAAVTQIMASEAEKVQQLLG